MLGHAAADAPRELGLSSSSGSSDLNTNINVVDSSHYITSGYSGVVTVANSTTEFGLFWKDIGGSILANSMVSSPPHWRVLAVNNKRYFWGPVSAGALNPNGMNITGRLLDHAVNASSIE